MATRTPMRSILRVLPVITAVLAVCWAAGSLAAGEDKKPTANTGAAIPVEAAVEQAPGNDAVSSWMHQTLARSKDSPRLQRAQADGSSSGRKSTLFDHETRTSTIDLLWPLLLVLGVIAAVALGIRRFLPRGNRLGGGGVIDVLASHYLSSKQSLCLVRLGRRGVLLGVTPERITPVAEILQPEELSEIVAAIESKRPTSFTSTFARLCVRDPEKKIDGEPAERPVVVPHEKLIRAGESVRGLVGRVRTLSGTEASAELT